MTTLAEFMIIAVADNRPPMLEKSLYDSWKSRMEFYMENRENGRMIIDLVQNGPLVWPTVVQEDGTTRKKTYAELSATEKLQVDCDCKATNIDRVKLLMQGTQLSLQEKECKLYDKFDKFSFVKVHSPQPYSPMYPPPHPSQPQISHLSIPRSQQYQSHQTSSVLQIAYNSPQPSTQPLIEFPQMDSGLDVVTSVI
ncbi:hypothetical protein Tco_0359152 [Tanacetum coccineum]